jgi:ADP-heptose:LPS heptosyltransferase
LVNAKVNFLPSKHLVDRYFDALSPLAIQNDGWGCEFYLDKEKINAEIAGLHETTYDVIVLGAAHATKRISLEKARDILRLHRRTTLLIGGKDVVVMAALLKKEFPNMHESAFIIRHAKMVFTGDTGMMHLAAAFQKKMVVLWGNTVPSFGMYPYYGPNNKDQSLYFENKTVGCRPCSKLGFAKCPKGHFDCMEKLVIDENAIEALDNA